MANRFFQQFRYALEKAPVSIFVKFTGAGAGANVTLDAANSKGVASISRTADGDYTITFQDKYVKLLDVNFSVLSKDGSTAPLANAFYVKSFSGGSASANATLAIRTFLATIGTLVSPGTNDEWRGEIVFSNSTAP